MASILITGGAGFIGSHTADRLIHEGHTVRILDLLDPQIHGNQAGFPEYMHPSVECIQGDLRSVEDVTRALDGIDVVYHFAALTGVGQSMYDIQSYVDTNCTGTAALLEVIVKTGVNLKAFILASSRAVYGEGTHSCPKHGYVFPPPRKRDDMEQGKFDVFCPECGARLMAAATQEDRPLRPLSVYALTKQQQEELCRYASHTYGLPVRILRYFNVYGSRQSLSNPYTGVVSIFFSRLKAGKTISLYEHGTPGRDFVHVSDVVQANLLALEADIEPGTCINIGAAQEYSIAEIAKALAQVCSCTADMRDSGEFRVGDIHSCYADIDRARQLLGYVPKISLKEGMHEFADWAVGQVAVDLYQQTVDELERYNLFGHAPSLS